MVEIFDKYLNQISKKLKKSVSSEFREEFLDNLEDQLYSMLSEVKLQEPEISDLDAEVSVLSNCESVDLVVSRVIMQFRSKDIVPDIDSEDFAEELKFLKPIESGLLFTARKLDNGIKNVSKLFKKLKAWYIRNENPILTAFCYLLILVSTIAILSLVFVLLPPLYQITTYPNNKTTYHFFDVPDSIWNNPEITSLSVTPVSQFVLTILLWIAAAMIILHISWNKKTDYALKTGIFISLILIMIDTIVLREGRLIPIKSRDISQPWLTLTQDWYRAFIPTFSEYISHFVNVTFLNTYILIFSFIFFLILIGSLLKKMIKERTFSRPLVFSVSRQGIKVILILICFGLMTIIPSRYSLYDIPIKEDIPIPNTEMSLIYKFNIDWEEGYLGDYSTQIPEFGNIRFQMYEFYNLTQNTQEISLFKTGKLELLMQKDLSESSKFAFPLLGILYLPSIIENRPWEDLIGHEINESYPFTGFHPNANHQVSFINWIINGKETDFPVNTISYNSTANQSSYIFSFDRTHGWLMQASLIRFNDDWTQGLELDTLTISRTFHINSISNVEEFYLLDALLITPIIVSIIMIFSSTSASLH